MKEKTLLDFKDDYMYISIIDECFLVNFLIDALAFIKKVKVGVPLAVSSP